MTKENEEKLLTIMLEVNKLRVMIRDLEDTAEDTKQFACINSFNNSIYCRSQELLQSLAKLENKK